jgi:hypothetical protein
LVIRSAEVLPDHFDRLASYRLSQGAPAFLHIKDLSLRVLLAFRQAMLVGVEKRVPFFFVPNQATLRCEHDLIA